MGSPLHRLLAPRKPMAIILPITRREDCKEGTLGPWAPSVLLRGSMGLTMPGNNQRKPLGWAPRVSEMAWGWYKEVFSRVLGRQLTVSRPPGSPSISWPEWKPGVGEEDLFPGFGASHSPGPHLPPGRRTMRSPHRGLPVVTGAQSRVDRPSAPQAPAQAPVHSIS